jgi:20S proteasome subunit beta 1
VFVADRAADKIDYVYDKIFCLRSGSAADTQTLSHYVRYYMNMHSIEIGKAPRVKTAANLFKNFIYEYKDRLSASIMIAGYDPVDGPVIYQIPPGGSLFQSKFGISGSGSTYLYGFCDEHYKENMTLEQARKFAISAVSHAQTRDGSSGGIIRIVNVT